MNISKDDLIKITQDRLNIVDNLRHNCRANPMFFGLRGEAGLLIRSSIRKCSEDLSSLLVEIPTSSVANSIQRLEDIQLRFNKATADIESKRKEYSGNAWVLSNPIPGGAILTAQGYLGDHPSWLPLSQDVFSVKDVQNLWFIKSRVDFPGVRRLCLLKKWEKGPFFLVAEFYQHGRKHWRDLAVIEGEPDWLFDIPRWTEND